MTATTTLVSPDGHEGFVDTGSPTDIALREAGWKEKGAAPAPKAPEPTKAPEPAKADAKAPEPAKDAPKEAGK